MYFKPLLLPLLAQVLLTLIVMYTMAKQRVNEMKRKKIHPQRVDNRRDSSKLFKDSAASLDNYHNQFESPVLFYVAILLTLMLMLQDNIIVVLAWGYVVLRYAHSIIHLTYNRVRHRFTVFMVSGVVLFAIWVRLGWLIIQA
jgi:hypothetical protein